jgi:hypothetical protein
MIMPVPPVPPVPPPEETQGPLPNIRCAIQTISSPCDLTISVYELWSFPPLEKAMIAPITTDTRTVYSIMLCAFRPYGLFFCRIPIYIFGCVSN